MKSGAYAAIMGSLNSNGLSAGLKAYELDVFALVCRWLVGAVALPHTNAPLPPWMLRTGGGGVKRLDGTRQMI